MIDHGLAVEDDLNDANAEAVVAFPGWWNETCDVVRGMNERFIQVKDKGFAFRKHGHALLVSGWSIWFGLFAVDRG